MNIINMTPHNVNLLGENGQEIYNFPPSGNIIRLAAKTVNAGTIEVQIPDLWSDGIIGQETIVVPITSTVFEGLPDTIYTYNHTDIIEYDNGLPVYNQTDIIGIETYYIVSQLVKSALPYRKDLLVPAEVQRDSNGNITGCQSLGI